MLLLEVNILENQKSSKPHKKIFLTKNSFDVLNYEKTEFM